MSTESNIPEWFIAYMDNMKQEIFSRIDTKIDNFQKSIDEVKATAVLAKSQANGALDIAKEARESSDALHDRMSSLEDQNQSLRHQVQELSSRINSLENYSRRSNLVFDGIEETENESPAALLGKVHNVLKSMNVSNSSAIRFERVHRLRSTKSQGPRPVIIRFTYYTDRAKVWANRRNLHGKTIYLREDFCLDTTKYRQSLLPVIKAARNKKMKATLVGDLLIIDGEMYTRDNLHKLPDDLQPQYLATKSNATALAFFSRHSPFSNFYPAPFVVGGKTFKCPEQFFSNSKAEFFGDTEAAKKIMSTDNPAVQKKFGSRIKGFNKDQWEQVCQDVMFSALTAKFQQNPLLLQILEQTGDKLLIEANPYDLYWGSGCGLHDKNCLDASKQKGANHLGKLLMRVRETLGHPS